MFEGVGILLELRIDLQNDVILIELREDGGDLALAESVVKGVINVRRKDTQTRGRIAIDGEGGQETLI